MNYYLLTSACLITIVAMIHSLLGEKLIVKPILRLDLPHILGSDFLTKKTLRLAWHLMSVAAFGFAGILFFYSFQVITNDASVTVKIISAVFIVSSVVSVFVAHGRHFSWWAFLLIGILAWLGSGA